MENQGLTVNAIACVVNNTIDNTNITYTLNGVKKRLEIQGFSNAKRSKSLSIYYFSQILDDADVVVNEQKMQYNETKPSTYDLMYGMDAFAGMSVGDTQFLNALNGAIARCEDLGGTPNGVDGNRPFDSDGTIKPEFA